LSHKRATTQYGTESGTPSGSAKVTLVLRDLVRAPLIAVLD